MSGKNKNQNKKEKQAENCNCKEKINQIEKLVNEIETLKSEKDKLIRAYAEKENENKRILNDAKSMTRYEKSKFAKDFLSVGDSLFKALENAKNIYIENKDNEAIAGLVKGIEMTEQAFLNTLSKNGITKIKTIDERFDPALHQAVQEIPSNKESGIILDEIQSGYKIDDKILREAMVVIAKKENSDKKKDENAK